MRSISRLLVITLAIHSPVFAVQIPVQTVQGKTGESKMHQATGSFEVKTKSMDVSSIGKEGGLGRMTIDKNFSGGIAGTSKGEMLTSMTESTGAMAYVALETVTATLNGRLGSFVLIHNATMDRADPNPGSPRVTVVPGSATGGMSGLVGTLSIHIDSTGKHTYNFEYELP